VSETARYDKALLFGRCPHDYLAEWEITSDFGLVRRKLGVEIEEVPREELAARCEALSKKESAEAAALAEALIAGADQGERPRPGDNEIVKATRLYMAMNAFLDERRADAATIVCNDFRTGGYQDFPVPCVALTFLQDRGIPAACQGDMDALLTMILFKRATGRVSFMGGARAEGERLTVSHCVLSRRMTGPGAAEPYHLADYHGTRPSPTIHTDLPRGQEVTVARLTRNLERLIVTRGTVVDSRDEPGSCRNTLEIEVEDVGKLMSAVRGVQYHLVLACGNHVSAMCDRATEAGVQVLRA
jgi:L-fucose isomerase-like protein